MTPKEQAVMQQALEALENYSKSDYIKKQHPKRRANGEKAITALREALAEQAEHEPVAWHHPQCDGQCIACLIEKAVQDAYGTQGRDYMLRHINAATPVRTKDLTDAELAKAADFYELLPQEIYIARTAIAADREKNNGSR